MASGRRCPAERSTVDPRLGADAIVCVLRWQKFGGVTVMGYGRMQRGKVGRGGSGERQF